MLSWIPCWVLEVIDFHKAATMPIRQLPLTSDRYAMPLSASDMAVGTKWESLSALFPVMGLWRACTRLKRQAVTSCYFSLTGILERVKTESFFDSFSKFFRLVRRPGLEPMSLS